MAMNALHNTVWGFISEEEYNYINSLYKLSTPYHTCLTINFDMTSTTPKGKWQVWLEQTQKEELVVGDKFEQIDSCLRDIILSFCKEQIRVKYNLKGVS